MLELRIHQEEVVQKLREGFANGHRCQLLYAPTGFGKCLAKGTTVIMYDGTIKLVQDIVIGDLLLSPEGHPRMVESIVNGFDMMYEITPSKGDAYCVNSSHILSLRMTGNKSSTWGGDGKQYFPKDIVNISIEDYIKSNKTFKHCAKGWRSDAIDFKTDTPLPVDPYILGAWLGDGTTKEPAITNIEPEIIDYIYQFANEISGRISIWDNGNCCTYRICGGNFLSDMKSIGVIGNKHIPHQYKTASIEARQRLLAGIIDTDGYMFMDNFEITLKVKTLADDICFVARSLGLAAYVKECTKTIKSRGFFGTYHRITISGETDQIPCLVQRKKAKTRYMNKNVRNVGIQVKEAGLGEYYGFSIAGNKKLFLLGDFTVTHNTEVAMAIMKAVADKYKKCAMVMDRIVLVDQTSRRLTKYGIEHGVMQAGHWRHRPYEHIQVCSAQTLEKRQAFPDIDLLIVDECHITRKGVVKFIQDNPQIKVIGLTATPFTKGLGDIYTHVVGATPTGDLIEKGWLVPLKVYVAKEIDMTGVTKRAGEWKAEDVTERGIKIVGDVVHEWHKKTHEIFGKPVKTIVFCAGVEHGRELVKKFAEAGYNFISISYLEDDQYKKDMIEEFSKPDTDIHGLIATDILTRGFDVPDVMIGVSARPFSKSFSSHVQQMGRIMRPNEGKEFGLWLDHSGNFLRFRKDWDKVFYEGVTELKESATEKTKKEPTEKEKKEAVCPACKALWIFKSNICGSCGFEKKPPTGVTSVNGELLELMASNSKGIIDNKQFYSELLYYCKNKGYKDGWAAHKYKERFGVFPRAIPEEIRPTSIQTMKWIKSRMIAYSKSKLAA